MIKDQRESLCCWFSACFVVPLLLIIVAGEGKRKNERFDSDDDVTTAKDPKNDHYASKGS